MKLQPWEAFLLGIVQAAAPTVENLFVHSQRGIAIFNASDNLFNEIGSTITVAQPATPATPATPAAA